VASYERVPSKEEAYARDRRKAARLRKGHSETTEEDAERFHCSLRKLYRHAIIASIISFVCFMSVTDIENIWNWRQALAAVPLVALGYLMLRIEITNGDWHNFDQR
jgi:hypothetical protein